ncbi:CGNR zinc finger domain-containing protein [Streptomyces sp. NPDC052109]|uniref:CGNR zinc finger domain-containing protein n=1 Tax=Streptomyces sp. NPDC052109 TaxID=3155527 RepID=UPI003426AB3C
MALVSARQVPHGALDPPAACQVGQHVGHRPVPRLHIHASSLRVTLAAPLTSRTGPVSRRNTSAPPARPPPARPPRPGAVVADADGHAPLTLDTALAAAPVTPGSPGPPTARGAPASPTPGIRPRPPRRPGLRPLVPAPRHGARRWCTTRCGNRVRAARARAARKAGSP